MADAGACVDQVERHRQAVELYVHLGELGTARLVDASRIAPDDSAKLANLRDRSGNAGRYVIRQDRERNRPVALTDGHGRWNFGGTGVASRIEASYR